MHVLFVHPAFPAQFGQPANYLATARGWPCTVVSATPTAHLRLPFTHVDYTPPLLPDDGRPHPQVEDLFAHLEAVHRGLRSLPDLRPDLVVGHTSYGTLLYLRTLYRCPFVGYFELLPPPFWTDALALRPDFPPTDEARLFNASFHALTYLHLHAADAAYTPTRFQRGTAPAELRPKLRVLPDGVDAAFFRPRRLPRPVTVGGRRVGPQTRVVSYVSRGLEAFRGFDIFMRVAARVARAVPDAVFLVAGEPRTFYGHELPHMGGRSFKDWVLAQDDYPLDRVAFLGTVEPAALADLYALSDLHVYLTVPYVLSWSLLQAMAAGCTVLGSATAPVEEVIDPGVHGLLAGFYDVDGLADAAVRVLRDPAAYRPLGAAARARVEERYELAGCLGRLAAFFEEVAGR